MNTETQVDNSTCAASGCPMCATHSRSTTGGGEWLCFIHFASDANDRFHVTAELTRLRWLVDVVRTLRAAQPLTPEQQQAFVMAQRSDLKQKDTEWPRDWMIRLEGVLAQSCKAAVQA